MPLQATERVGQRPWTVDMIKNDLRNSIGQERLINIYVLYIRTCCTKEIDVEKNVLTFVQILRLEEWCFD